MILATEQGDPMVPPNVERKLAAILSADVVGYSRLMAEDEQGTIRTLTGYREEIAMLVRQHRGRVVDSPGDNLLAEFPTALDAVQAAVEIQRVIGARNADLSAERRMEFRIGVHLGDISVEGERVYGDGVNIAARLEGLADPAGICISDMVYKQVQHKLNLGFEDLGDQEVKNIPEPVRAYRVRPEAVAVTPEAESRPPRRVAPFVAVAAVVVAVIAVLWGIYPRPIAVEEPVPATGLELPDKPSIAVLPFANMSDDPGQEYFSDGISEDLITDLSRISGLFVISRNSSFVYKGRPVSVQQVGRDLGVRYVLEGSVRKANDRVRITAQLVDATTGGHVWADRYDRKLEDIFALQDEVTGKIVDALEVSLTESERAGIERIPTENLEAYDYFQRGVRFIFRFTPESMRQGRAMLETAIELDSEFAGAHAALAMTYFNEWWAQWRPGSQPMDRAVELAKRALALDDSLPLPHEVLAFDHVRNGRHEKAVAEAETAVALGPSVGEPYAMLAEVLNLAGRPEEAIPNAKQAIRLNPRASFAYRPILAESLRQIGRHDEAVSELQRSLDDNPFFLLANVVLAHVLVELGMEDAAKRAAAQVVTISPGYSLKAVREMVPYKDPAQTDSLIANLRKAGLPE
jgi:adenylate cyclase